MLLVRGGGAAMSVYSQDGVRHRLTSMMIPNIAPTTAYHHRRAVCHRWFSLFTVDEDGPVTCLWCVAFGKKRTQDE